VSFVVKRWRRLIIEVYNGDGFHGSYEPKSNPPDPRYDDDDLARFVQQIIRGKLAMGNAVLRFCEDGGDLIIAVFDGADPPDWPKRGHEYIPPWSDPGHLTR